MNTKNMLPKRQAWLFYPFPAPAASKMMKVVTGSKKTLLNAGHDVLLHQVVPDDFNNIRDAVSQMCKKPANSDNYSYRRHGNRP
jgi:hypothetical protein